MLMGEVVVTSEDLEVVRIEEEEEEMNKSKEGQERGEGEGSVKSGVVRWERLLPRMVLTVLLVEADDSTRQIIAALLRKCSYRVAAVPDGLKAWEVLKGKPHNIDLILTEVDLPSISGYALLTLIMEHEICKNIPVIMMSSKDSVSLVYKCMLRGAADYLVKPLRRNELRNLWQHVWRRRSSHFGGSGPLDGSTRQDKVEGTSENDAASYYGSGDMACIQRSKEYIEKGSDAQSSCTKPDMEAESAQVEEVQDPVQPVRRNFPNNKEVHRQEMHENIGQQCRMDENEPGVAACNGAVAVMKAENKRLNDSDAHEVCDNNDVFVNSSREAIDFMGTSSYHDSCSNNVKGKFEYSPHLDLSLRRSSSFDIQVAEEKNMLRHSSASAFTRYTSRALQPLCSTSATVLNSEPGVDSDQRRSTNVSIHISSTLGQSPSTQRSIISLDADQTKESELSTCPKQRVIPIQIPMEGMTFNKLCTSYRSVFPPMLAKQSSASPNPSPSSASQRESNPKAKPYLHSNFEINSAYLHHLNTNDPTNQSLQKQEQDHKLDNLEENVHISPATDQSANSSFCNGALSRLNGMGHGSTSGSNSNLDQVATVRAAAKSKNEENIFAQNSNSHRSIQREVALNKFRMKRKDRCYEKKVRYESRKKLAEQRPRVKGQFVRQAQVDPPPAGNQIVLS